MLLKPEDFYDEALALMERIVPELLSLLPMRP